MFAKTRYALLVILPILLCSCRSSPTSPRFEIMAVLTMPQQVRFIPHNQAFRSVVLQMPYAYVLDREGHLYIFKISRMHNGKDLQALKVMNNVGDGNDLAIFDSVLVSTRQGSLEAYSLNNPEQPEYIGRFGPSAKHYHSQTIVCHGDLAFLIGKGSILSYDLSLPSRPIYLTDHENDRDGRTGCAAGNYLYVGETHSKKSYRQGIIVYDITDPRDLQEVGFVATSRSPYHLFLLPENRLIACMDADSRVHLVSPDNITVHGNSAVFSLSNPVQPLLVQEISESGGRAATVLSIKDGAYLVCNGRIFLIDGHSLKDCFVFFPHGSTLDGFPYHGDIDGSHAALALDDVAIVIHHRSNKE